MWLVLVERPLMCTKRSIPNPGTNLGFGFDPRSGRLWEATDPSLSHQTDASLSQINK